MSNVHDVIVVGVGGMGSAACYHLASRGKRVLGLERFTIPHTMGSSHGLTRIIRLAYHESPAYVPIVRRAMELWRDLGERFGEPLMFTTGSLDAGPDGGGFFSDSLAACREHDLPHEILSATDINRRFPAFSLPSHHAGLFQPDGGFIASERAIVAHAELARAAGADIHTGEQVLGWEETAAGVRVTTTNGTYEAGQLILSAGAWMADLLPRLRNVAVPERQVLGWFHPKPGTEAHFMPDAMPVAILMVDEGPYFMLPTWGAPGLKIGLHHHQREAGQAESLSRTPTEVDEELLRICLSRYLPDANGPVANLQGCVYTNTPDEHFILDRLPGAGHVIVASPCSGHGYKFASAIGEILADLADGTGSRFDLEMFSMNRFAVA